MNGKSILKCACVSLLALAAPPAFLAAKAAAQVSSASAEKPLARTAAIPLTFEPNLGQAGPNAALIGRGRGLTVVLTPKGISLEILAPARPGSHPASLHLRLQGAGKLAWHGDRRLRGESNYFIGNNPRLWRTHIPHFARAEATVAPGVDLVLYGNNAGVEYDLHLAPGTDPSQLRLSVGGAPPIHLTRNGDLLLRAGEAELRMRRPVIYQESARTAQSRRKMIDGGYVLLSDNSIGFRVSPHDPRSSLVIDPTVSIGYATFLGGTGTDAASSIALDASGNLYVGGTTTSVTSFSAAARSVGPGGGASEFFIAKIDPTVSGPASLLHLTFLGGSGMQYGGLIAATSTGAVAITGATTSPDFPVTDSTQPSRALESGLGRDIAVSELDPTGSALVFSTLLGGSGTQSQNSNGGIALDSSGDVYIASDTEITSLDTTSTDLPVTSGAYQATWDGQPSDGFLAKYQPPAQSGGAATLQYCSYLGANAQTVSIGGIAVDTTGSAYIAGTVANPNTAFPFTNAFQNSYGGGSSDGFLMKLAPVGQGPIDLVYATLLGGSGADQALGVALDSNKPPSAYVTGTTSSPDFPMSTRILPFAATLAPNASANAFLSVVGQSGTGSTSLLYSTYLGGSSTDAGQSIAVAAPNAVYLAGSTTSWNFPWRDNVQPFSGASDAFVAKLDPTSSGAASLVYATSLGGTSPPGANAGATANAVVADTSGHAYVAGATTSPDFPAAVTSGGAGINGFQSACASCSWSPAASDAFMAELYDGTGTQPGVSFTLPHLNFGFSPQLVGVKNTGDAPLNISGLEITGPNSADFAMTGQGSCTVASIPPGVCGIDVSFSPSAIGYETAFLTVTDNAPGSPHLLELTGAAPGLVASPTSLNFPSISAGTASLPQQVNFAVTQIGQQTLHFDVMPFLAGPNAAQFQLAAQGSACTPISASSCSYTVIFAPQSAGSFGAEIDFSYDLSGGPVQTLRVPLAGSATTPPAVAVLASVNFGSQLAGTSGTPQPINVANSAAAPAGALAFGTISVAGPNAGDFAITSDSCASASTPAGGSCAIQIAFRPAQAGVCGTETARSASLTLVDNAPNSPQTVALSGNAMDFCFSAPSGQAASAPIAQGATANYSLQLNSSAGFSGSVALACSGAPSEAACSLSPSTVTVAPNAPGTFTVSVSTTAPSGSSSRLIAPPATPRSPSRRALTTESSLLLLCALALYMRNRNVWQVRVVQAGLLVLVLGAGLAACGGGGVAASDPDPGTPVGSYTITVTATVNSTSPAVTRTIQLPLTVN